MRSFIHIDRLSKQLKNFVLNSTHKPDFYNLVENSYSINEIVDALKEVYPNLELTYLTQNMKMRSLKVNLDSRLQNDSFNKDLLKSDLIEFKNHFSF